MAVYLGSFAGLLVIACAHLFVRQIFGVAKSRQMLIHLLTGVAIAYAFIDVFPHLASMQNTLEAATGSSMFVYLAHHAYLMALLGFLVYLGVETSLIDTPPDASVRWRHLLIVASMMLYGFLVGYMLSEQPTHRPEPVMLFAIAMAAHWLGLNFANRELNPDAYDRYFRYFLLASTTLGWLTGIFFELSDATYALWFAYLAGGIVAVGVATDLPHVDSIRAFAAFSVGALLFCALILMLEATRA